MLIKKIKLSNYRCYQDAEIDFSTDKERNVTVIVGNNAAGKTTLLNAFIYCLYRINKFDSDILNKDTELSMRIGDTEYVTVTLEISHDGFEYKISTNEAYNKLADGRVTKTKQATTTVTKRDTKTGQSYPYNSYDAINEINSILPEELSQYFFLAGEDVNTVTKKSNLSKAVRQILQLESIKNGTRYFSQADGSSVYNAIKKDMQLSSSKDSIDDIVIRREKKFLEISDCENTINDSQKGYEDFCIRKEKLEAELNANKDVEQYQRQKNNAIYDMNRAKHTMEESYSSMMKIINDYATHYMISYNYLKNDIKGLLGKSNLVNRKSITHISEEAIDDIINRGFCICGCNLENNEKAIKHLEEEKQYIPPHDYSASIKTFIDNEDMNATYIGQTKKNISRHGEDYLNAVEQYEEAEQIIKNINSKLEGRQDVGKIAQELRECERQISTFSQRIANNSGKLEVYKDELRELEEKFKLLEVQNDKNKKIREYLSYCDQIKFLLENTLAKKTKLAREKLQEKVQELYDNMFTGNRQIKIAEDFTVTTFDAKSGKLDETGGTEAIKNFSFIGGLTSLAKDLSLNNDSDDVEVDGEIYPLVLDAPFSHTDEIHTASSAKILPYTSEQVIFIVMRKDFTLAEPYLSNKIGMKYTIVNDHQTLTSINKEEC